MESLWGYVNWISPSKKESAAQGPVTTVPAKLSDKQHIRRCGLCEEELIPSLDSRELLCGHSLCYKCAQQQQYAGVIQCPVDNCQQATLIEEDDKATKPNQIPLPNYTFHEAPLTKSFVPVPLDITKHEEVQEVDLLFKQSDSSVQEEDLPDDDNVDGFVVVDRKPVKIEPNYYVPFTQNKDLCKTLIQHWLSTIWLTPCDLNEKKEIFEPRPVYVPFYSFQVHSYTSYSVELGRSEHSHHHNNNTDNNNNYQPRSSRSSSVSATAESILGTATSMVGGKKIMSSHNNIVWEEKEGAFESTYEELVVCASYSLDRELLNGLLRNHGFSLQTHRLLPTSPLKYKPGALNSTRFVNPETNQEEPVKILPVDVSREDAFTQLIGGKEQICRWEEQHCRSKLKENRAEWPHMQNLVCKTTIKKLDTTVILLPIFISGFSYQSASYEVFISGNQGTVEGKRPYGTGFVGKMCLQAINSASTFIGDSI